MWRTLFIALSAIMLVALIGCYVTFGHMLHTGFSTRQEPTALEAKIALTLRNSAIPGQYKSMKNPVPPTPGVIHDGMAHWADHCATCHANNGNGETMYGRTMYPRPPDMRQSRTQEMSDGELYYIIKNGIQLSGMPAFGEPGDNDLDSWKLVAFIRHLPTLSQDQELEMEQLNPKSPDEIQEERQEEEFLNGSSSAQKEPNNHRRRDQ